MFDKNQPNYLDFRKRFSERTNPIVAWVGSGLSSDAGLPTWPGLKEHLLQTLKGTSQTLEPSERKKTEGRIQYIKGETNFWRAFDALYEDLGATSYKATIRKTLTPALTCKIPRTYEYLWEMQVAGILNLNLDRLATRAYTAQHPGELFHEINGTKASSSAHILKSPRPFIANLHGVSDDESTWVFRKPELDRLLSNDGYKTFISTCLVSRTVLFLGITADDLAVGSHLERLRALSMDVGEHYWVTSRRDQETERWAESVGIRVIRYNAPNNDHSDLLEFFTDVLAFKSHDTLPPPIAPVVDAMATAPLPSVSELLKLDAEEIRQALNAEAARILAPQTDAANAEYERFCAKYDQAIYRAWYVDTEAPTNNLLGYTLSEQVARGAFGTVYRALDPSGSLVAVKVLHEGIRKQTNLLQTFRRGVRSMRILSDGNVHGMVPYIQHSEIPAFVVMEFIEGPNLKDAVDARQLTEWSDRLAIAKRVSSIILEAHRLPASVLHRDIRPPNIMLRGFYTEDNRQDVVVLDFDLSWHKGAAEESVVFANTLTGYLAPEQLSRSASASSRSAAVDSFGLGMTLYFLASGEDPQFGQHKHRDWSEVLRQKVASDECSAWKSVPERFCRLIEACTQDQQGRRWSMSRIDTELGRLLDATNTPDAVDSAELLAEEALARSDYRGRYQWKDEELSGTIDLPTGLFLRISAHELEREITIEISWAASGGEARRNVIKYIPKSADSIEATLRRLNCRVLTKNHSSLELKIVAKLSVFILKDNIDDFSAALNEIAGTLRFE